MKTKNEQTIDAFKEYQRKHQKPKTIKRTYSKIGRNDLCPCKSGKKYKHCCLIY
jgi:uncharacterized protein YecA (UPF0149 family)